MTLVVMRRTTGLPGMLAENNGARRPTTWMLDTMSGG
jgi:hypothetical protein